MKQVNTTKLLPAILLVSALFIQGCGQKAAETNTTKTDTSHVAVAEPKAESHESHGCGSGSNPCYDQVGTNQSPIDISKNTQYSIKAGSDLFTLKSKSGPTPVTCITDASHGDSFANFSVNLNNPSEENSIKLNGVVFNLVKFHFHRKSEHIIPRENNEANMEVHFIYQNADMKSNLVVFGVIFNGGKDSNKFAAQLWPVFSKMVTDIAPKQDSVDFSKLVPGDWAKEFKTYWSYAGSLTTPCYSEGVTWVVSEKIVSMSKEQIDQFNKFTYQGKYPIGTSRETQELKNRILTKR